MVDTTVDWHTAVRAFTRAVGVAAAAPSINNSQPWWWRLDRDACELRAQRDRQLSVTDRDGRQLLFSCGTALHHARVALAAEGWRVDVDRLPERGKPDLLARLRLTGQTVPDVAAVRLSHAVHLRYTDRRPLSTRRVDEEAVAAVEAAIEAEGSQLLVLRRDQMIELGAIARSALEIERAQSSWLEEVAYWTGPGWRPAGTGIPAGAIPERPAEDVVPNRDFGRPGTLPVGSTDDRAGTFGVLYGAQDEPSAWLRAGEALSAAWLTAAELGVSLLPMSAPIVIPSTREALRQLISGAGHPYMVLRLGIPDSMQPPPERTPRLSPDGILATVPP